VRRDTHSVKTTVAQDLIDQCVARVGWVNGARLARFVAKWAITACELGCAPDPEEFAMRWGERSPRRARRGLRLFRRAFPELGADATPSALASATKRTGELMPDTRVGDCHGCLRQTD